MSICLDSPFFLPLAKNSESRLVSGTAIFLPTANRWQGVAHCVPPRRHQSCQAAVGCSPHYCSGSHFLFLAACLACLLRSEVGTHFATQRHTLFLWGHRCVCAALYFAAPHRRPSCPQTPCGGVGGAASATQKNRRKDRRFFVSLRAAGAAKPIQAHFDLILQFLIDQIQVYSFFAKGVFEFTASIFADLPPLAKSRFDEMHFYLRFELLD